MKLSNLADTLIGSEIVRLGNEINDRIRQGEKIYNFTIGDFDPTVFPIPARLEEEIIESYKQKHTNYPPGDGVLELRTAVTHFLAERHDLTYQPNEVLIAAGGRPLIYCIFKTIVDKGDKVIYAVPSWNNNHYVHMNDGIHCTIEAKPENNFMPTAAEIEPHLAGATLLCLCSPQNPTGTTLPKEELEKICDLVLAENAGRLSGKKLYVMYDQIYSVLTYGNIQHYNPVSLRPEMKEYTLFVDGISKAFAATGLRLGWSVGPAVIIAKMKAILSHLGAWSPMAEQKATARYLGMSSEITAFLENFKSEISERLNRIYDGFIQLKQQGFKVDAVTPQAAIYLTIKLDLTGQKTSEGKTLATQSDVTSYILSEAKIAVVPFYAFGAGPDSQWYRLSVGTCIKDEISAVMDNLQKALSKLEPGERNHSGNDII